MDNKNYYGQLDTERNKNRKLTVVIVVMAVIILVQTSTIRSQVGRERVEFLPPEITKPFWVSGTEASPEYFEQMAVYLNGIVVNVTPETIETSRDRFFEYILPRDRDTFRKDSDVAISRVRRDNASSMFVPRESRVDLSAKTVTILGDLSTYVQEKRVSKTQAAYKITFVRADGRWYVKAHEKVDPDAPNRS